MLYVSRLNKNENIVFVFDTDTGHEVKYNIYELGSIIKHTGLTVQGAMLDDNDHLVCEVYRYSVNSKTSKALVILDIKVQVNNENVVTNFKPLADKVVFRPSDYGVGIGDYFIEPNDYSFTLVLDDKLKYLTTKSFANISAYYYNRRTVDVSELTDADLVYKCYVNNGGDSAFYILDRVPNRKSDKLSLYFLTGRLSTTYAHYIGTLSVEADLAFLDKYKNRLLNYVDSLEDLTMIKDTAIRRNYDIVKSFIELDIDDFVKADPVNNLSCLTRSFALDNKLHTCFIRYIGCGGRDEDIFKAYRKILSIVYNMLARYKGAWENSKKEEL